MFVMRYQDLQLAKRLNPHNSALKVDRYPGQGLCSELVGQPVSQILRRIISMLPRIWRKIQDYRGQEIVFSPMLLLN